MKVQTARPLDGLWMELWRGFRVGILLQLAIGPISLYVFRLAAAQGFLAALPGVLAVTVVDFLFVLAAILGLGAWIRKSPRVRTGLKWFGGVVLILFGAFTILDAFGISLLPGLSLTGSDQGGMPGWLYAALLTLSSPLTIVFWAGVFSTQLAKRQLSLGAQFRFGVGAVLATPLFQALVALLGSLTHTFLPSLAIQILTAVVGGVLVALGVRSLAQKSESETPA